MKKILSIFPIALAVLAATGCDTKVEKLEIQHFNTYDMEKDAEDPYYVDLRQWKESSHTISYVYFARWAPPEGATSLFIEYKTMRPRLMALPDSLDIVNLWMGTPMKEEYTDACFYGNVKNQETGEIERAPMHTYDYSPNAYADLEYCQKVKGTRFVMHADASHYGQEFDLLDEATGEVKHWTVQRGDRASIEAYAKLVVDIVNTHGLDGVDFDYEGWSADDMFTCIQKAGEYFGPKGSDPSKLLIIDYFGSYPGANVEPYIDYLVKQAYSMQGSGVGGPSWCPEEKMVYCEQYEQSSSEGPNYLNGGYTTSMTTDEGTPMFTLERYARYAHEAGNGRGGFGAYYIDNDYDNGMDALQKKGYRGSFSTYAFLRRAIQIINPAGK
ncbi:MAG: hypothetical protein IKP01_10565 [Bacteroidales bacterium]|nr:hypothetical protein [Bacteroidales bacterium]MBR3097080.1 hypothetical protein [Bacteroidales bacterium]MBR4688750.1 hypothetical protein [Bacteroidales bacterium]